MAHYYELPSGPRVNLRLARPRDREPIRVLFADHGTLLGELELARLASFDPRRRLVICATALLHSASTLVGVGAIELEEPATAVPGPVIADEARAPGLTELLTDALTGRARALARTRAA